MKHSRSLALSVGSLALAVGISVAPATTFQFVTVGNPGNVADPLNSGSISGIGSVSEEYRIATTEVTIGQYTEFLNAVASTDTHELYHLSMGTSGNIGNIIQSGSFGSFTYAVQGGDDPSLPVTYVDWYDTLRFANWMHNGQPTGMQLAGTTEDGAYTFAATTTVGGRNLGATFFLPTENEWYKAAYYDPTPGAGGGDNYWLYSFQTNSVPYSDNPTMLNTPDDTRASNFFRDDLTANGFNEGYAVSGSTSISPSQLYLTPVGAYGSATSFYGAHDMAGNLQEWNETTFDGGRVLRGGGWNSGGVGLRSSSPDVVNAGGGGDVVGFRIAGVVPEPSRVLLAMVGVLGVLLRRERFV